MNVERETLVIVFLIGVLLAPMWYLALYSMHPQPEVALSQEQEAIDPTGRFLPTPVEVNVFASGVITWVALFVLGGMIFYTHQFIRTVGRTSDRETETADIEDALPSYLRTDDRQLLNYWPANIATPGMIGVVVTAWSAVVFALLFVREALTWSRAQFLGVYGGMLFLSLGVFVAVYATWFLPSMHVVDEREHERRLTEDDGGDR